MLVPAPVSFVRPHFLQREELPCGEELGRCVLLDKVGEVVWHLDPLLDG